MIPNLQPPATIGDLPSMSLQEELQFVQQELQQALTDLYAPLADLARNQFQRIQPLTRAGLVLAVGVGDPDHSTLRRQRLSLAAAQEMLFLALSIHKLLLVPQPAQQDEQQKPLMGGIILTGDYCFTRSAILAAQTDQVQVVELFSQALKAISEGLLRNFFAGRVPVSPSQSEEHAPLYQEQTDLFISGVQAAAVLANLPERATADLVDLAYMLAHQSPPYDLSALRAQAQTIRQLASPQRTRLDAFLTWLAA
ncbi:MAG: hypothetical protein R3E79_50860 [Caldilineaceae bacterium]